MSSELMTQRINEIVELLTSNLEKKEPHFQVKFELLFEAYAIELFSESDEDRAKAAFDAIQKIDGTKRDAARNLYKDAMMSYRANKSNKPKGMAN